MELNVQFLGDASKNCTAWVRGQVNQEDELKATEFLNLNDIAAAATGRRPRTLQLASALWTLQEKLGLYVWTEERKELKDLLLIMESRNFIRLERDISLENWSGKLYLEPFNITAPRMFWFQLDFDKAFAK